MSYVSGPHEPDRSLIDSMYQMLETKIGKENLDLIAENGSEKDAVLDKIVKKFFLAAKENEGKTTIQFKAKPLAWSFVHFWRKLFGFSTKGSTKLEKAVTEMRKIYDALPGNNPKERVIKDVLNAIITKTGSGEPIVIKVQDIGQRTLQENSRIEEARTLIDNAMRTINAPAFKPLMNKLDAASKDPAALEQFLSDFPGKLKILSTQCEKVLEGMDRLTEMRSELEHMPGQENRRLGLHLRYIALEETMCGLVDGTVSFDECKKQLASADKAIAQAKNGLKRPIQHGQKREGARRPLPPPPGQKQAEASRALLEKYATSLPRKMELIAVSAGIGAMKVCFQDLEKAQNKDEVLKTKEAFVELLIDYEQKLLKDHQKAPPAPPVALQKVAARRGVITGKKEPLLTRALGIEFPELRNQALEILKIAMPKNLEEAKKTIANFSQIEKQKKQDFEELYDQVVAKRRELAVVKKGAQATWQNMRTTFESFEIEAKRILGGITFTTASLKQYSDKMVRALSKEISALMPAESEEQLQQKIASLRQKLGAIKKDPDAHLLPILEEAYRKELEDKKQSMGQRYAKDFKAYPFLQTAFTEALKPTETGRKKFGGQQKDHLEAVLEPHEMVLTGLQNAEHEINQVRKRLTEIDELHTELRNKIKNVSVKGKPDALQEVVETIKAKYPLLLVEDFEPDDLAEFFDEVSTAIEPQAETKEAFFKQTDQIKDGYTYLLKNGLQRLAALEKGGLTSRAPQATDGTTDEEGNKITEAFKGGLGGMRGLQRKIDREASQDSDNEDW